MGVRAHRFSQDEKPQVTPLPSPRATPGKLTNPRLSAGNARSEVRNDAISDASRRFPSRVLDVHSSMLDKFFKSTSTPQKRCCELTREKISRCRKIIREHRVLFLSYNVLRHVKRAVSYTFIINETRVKKKMKGLLHIKLFNGRTKEKNTRR